MRSVTKALAVLCMALVVGATPVVREAGVRVE
jgi:hypothetical protein